MMQSHKWESTLLDAGILKICKLKTKSEPGKMPVQRLVRGQSCYYGERVVGYGRQYAAKGASEQVDLLLRIWQDKTVRSGMYVLLENGEQYRIGMVQHLKDDDGLLVTDLSVERIDELYELAEET